MRLPLVSVIMPAYNAAAHIGEAIASVQTQSWLNWELLVVNDGSSDGTAIILDALADERIIVLHQENNGVSAARNAALDRATGAFIAFLDADDIMPTKSLESRAKMLMGRAELCFVDGIVLGLRMANEEEAIIHAPSFQGLPLDPLIAMQGHCFFGNTWMIRRTPATTDKRFPLHMRHAEDLAYYLSMAHAGVYDHVAEPVLWYRQGHGSAMSDLKGLELGYRQLYAFVRELEPAPSVAKLTAMRSRMRRIMFRSYLRKGSLLDALRMKVLPFPGM